MSNPSPTRLSPAELRKRLLAPPADNSSAPAPAPEEAPPPAPRPTQKRYGTMATQAAINLESLVAEMSPQSNGRAPSMPPTPMPYQPTPMPASMQAPIQMPMPATMQQMPDAYGALNGAFANYQQELHQVRMQNAELHRIVEEMKPVLEEAAVSEQRFTEKENTYIGMVKEKDARIGELEEKVKALEEQLAAVPAPRVPKTRDELEEWSDDLEKEAAKITQERRRMDEDRRQLKEDEEALEKQMREMEVSMARERAMIARQETELRRLSAEIQHELEVLQRGDGTLREQLSKFQRKHQEVFANGSSGPPPTPLPEPIPIGPPPVPGKKDSGLLRRIFRGGK